MILLNQEQRRAVETTEGPLLILAGAGAGKTKTITERIVHIIKKGTAGEHILAVTFTNKAAKEMESRILSRLGEEGILSSLSPYSGRPVIKTFHSLGVLIIRENAQKLGLHKHFTILSTDDSLSIIKDCLRELSLDPKQYEPNKIKNAISRYKGDAISREAFGAGSTSYFHQIVHDVWKKYEEALAAQHALDFDDLLIKTVWLLNTHKDICASYQERFTYIHIDEYQDTNQIQYELCTLLAAKHRNICVVGDSDQNIYSWRGANIKNILSFEKEYKDAVTILLEQNYRSTQTILAAANAVIQKNTIRKDKNLFTEGPVGEPISLVENWDEVCEARFVAESIRGLLEKGTEPRDIAILYRANFQSRVLEEAMLEKGVPYQVLGIRFFERKEIRDVISYLRVAMNRDSAQDMKRALEMPKRGIGKVTMLKVLSGQGAELPLSMKKKLHDFFTLLDTIQTQAKEAPLSEVITYIVQHSGIEKELVQGSDDDKERLENIRELVSLATKYDHMEREEALLKFFEESTLVSDQDTDTNEQGAVRMMTVHAAKGLEFHTVYIVGLEQDLFPHKRIGTSSQTKEEKEEERRLFYVALTRAKEKLYLSYAEMRTLFGSKQIGSPSEFLSDIDESLIMREEGGERGGSTIVYL